MAYESRSLSSLSMKICSTISFRHHIEVKTKPHQTCPESERQQPRSNTSTPHSAQSNFSRGDPTELLQPSPFPFPVDNLRLSEVLGSAQPHSLTADLTAINLSELENLQFDPIARVLNAPMTAHASSSAIPKRG